MKPFMQAIRMWKARSLPMPILCIPSAPCTKSFTAAAIAVLCDKGLLHLDDPVVKIIPEFDHV